MEAKSLLLLRHAKSDWSVEVPDWLRPLNKRGERAAKLMGQWMLHQHLQPALIISSPAKRAYSTAKKISKALNIDKERIVQDERLYNATLELLLQVIRACPIDAKQVLLVGHNPGLEILLHSLVQNPEVLPQNAKLLPTAALAQLSLPTSWADIEIQQAQLVTLTYPKQLPLAFTNALM